MDEHRAMIENGRNRREVRRLKAEIERLRGALKRIADVDFANPATNLAQLAVVETARAALRGEDA